jgi:hypothetical protein
VENYFNYFTEIEEHFQRRRGGALLLSTLDWALIETWRDAGVPLEAVLRGVDAAFDRYEQRPSKTKKINGLAYCAQEVLSAAEEMKDAAVGGGPERAVNRGFEVAEIAQFLRRSAANLEAARLPSRPGVRPELVVGDVARTLEQIALEIEANSNRLGLEDLERRLTVLEEKLLALLVSVVAEEQMVGIRAQADRELAAYRSKMPASQVDLLLRQYTHKTLFERYGLPRLSLFYM